MSGSRQKRTTIVPVHVMSKSGQEGITTVSVSKPSLKGTSTMLQGIDYLTSHKYMQETMYEVSSAIVNEIGSLYSIIQPESCSRTPNQPAKQMIWVKLSIEVLGNVLIPWSFLYHLDYCLNLWPAMLLYYRQNVYDLKTGSKIGEMAIKCAYMVSLNM